MPRLSMTATFVDRMVCGRCLDAFIGEIERFHGFPAPGLVLGGFMVDRAQDQIGPAVEYDAIVETRHCLPDAVQLFTPCTVGNGWMKILDWDKFAVTLYDRRTLSGVRVWLDLQKTARYPHLYNWYLKKVGKKELPLETLLETILDAGSAVLSHQSIRMTRFYARDKKQAVALCPVCGEAYDVKKGALCMTCAEGGYFEAVPECCAPSEAPLSLNPDIRS